MLFGKTMVEFKSKMDVDVPPKCAAAEGVQLAQGLEDRTGCSDAKLEVKWHSDIHACARRQGVTRRLGLGLDLRTRT